MKKKTIAIISMSIVLSITTIASTASLSKAGLDPNKKTSVGNNNSNVSKAAIVVNGKASYHADDLNSLIKDSSLIVVAQATDNQTEETFQMVNFVITQLNVKKILKDNGLVGDKISLLQTVVDCDPTVKKGDKVLLFLDKYEGPIPGAADAYVCKGLYQGNYKITADKITPSKDDNAKLVTDIQQIKGVDELKTKVDAIQSRK